MPRHIDNGRPRPPRRARWLAGALSSVLTTAGVVAIGPPAQAADESFSRVIVELSEPAAIASLGAGATGPQLSTQQVQQIAQTRQALVSKHRDLLAKARESGIHIRDERSATLLVNTIALQVPTAQVNRLAALPGVAAIHPDKQVHATVDHSVPLVGAPDVWKRKDGGGNPVRGQGVTIAVIDTGIDYTHPDLGGGFGPGKRVVAGYDFANDDADPMDDNGHGTHVAGIAAGNGGVTGVAPEAQLTAYKVLDDYGSGLESWVLAGLEAAVDPANPHRADVINLSLGFPGDGTDPVSRAATAATKMGVVVVAAAGNSGPRRQTVSSPAAADGVISVGASVSGLRMPTARLVEPVRERLQTFRVGISANPPDEPVTGDLVDVGMATPEELDRAGDLRGKVVVAFGQYPREPSDTPSQLLQTAQEIERRGAVAMLTHQELIGGPVLSGGFSATAGAQKSGDSFRMDRLVVLAMDPKQLDELRRHMANGKVRIAVEGTDATDRLATFSSRGPSATLALKPDLVAPGVEIRSTYPKQFWEPGELRFSGTSMASPHVAGAAALLRQTRPDLTPAEVRAALVTSATPLPDLGPTEQGAGRLNVAKAIDTTVIAEQPTLSLGIADLAEPGGGTTATTKLRVRNLGTKPATVAFDVANAPSSVGAAEVTPQSATIPAGGDVELTLLVRASTIDPARDSELSGWVIGDVAGTDHDLRVPFLLAAQPLIVHTTPDPSDGSTEVFVHTRVPVKAAPTVRVIPERGKPFEVTARPDHDLWYRAAVSTEKTGAYRVEARAQTATGGQLVGSDTFEVVAKENGPGGRRWEAVGPNSNAWQLATTPKAPRRAVLWTAASPALWLTDDRGETWNRVDRLPVARGGVGALVIDPADDRRMWYAINGRGGGYLNWLLDPTYEGKILYTEDRGRTWTTLDFPDMHIDGLLGSPDGRSLVAVSAGGYVVSHDRGRTWVFHQDPFGPFVTAVALSRGTLLVATPKAVYAVEDVFGEPKRARMVDRPKDEQVVGMVADDTGAISIHMDGTVWSATDVTGEWSQLSTLPNNGVTAFRKVGGALYVGVYGEIFVSRDVGRTWATLPSPAREAPITDFDTWPDQTDALLVSAEQGGLFVTRDAGAGYRRIGVPGLTAYDVATAIGADGKPTLVTTTDSDSYQRPLPPKRLSPGDTEWGRSDEGRVTGTKSLLAVSAKDPRVVWKSLYSPFTRIHEIQRSVDGGRTWTVITEVWDGLFALAVHPADGDRVVASVADGYGQGLSVTRDGGATWRRLHLDMTFDVVAGDPTDPDRLWLGNASGLYRSDDFGQTVVKVTDGRVGAVLVGPGSRLVIGGDQIRFSEDGGRTFKIADTGALPMRVSDLVAVPGAPSTIYAGTDGHTVDDLPRGGRGVLRSTDGGRTWQNVSGGLQSTSVTSLAISPDGQWLFAGTEAGVHRLAHR